MGKEQTKPKKVESNKEKKDFLPGSETEEQFESVLSLLSNWMKADIVDVDMDTDGDIRFDLPSEMRDLLGTQTPSDLVHENVIAIIRDEIPLLISASFEKKPEQRLKHLLPEKLYEKIDLMVKRSEKAVSALLNKKLKERMLLRRTTRSYIVDQIKSMKSTYHVETSKGEKFDVPHLSLEFIFVKPGSGRTLVMNPKESTIRLTPEDNVKVTVDLHQDDIRDLVKELKKIEEK